MSSGKVELLHIPRVVQNLTVAPPAPIAGDRSRGKIWRTPPGIVSPPALWLEVDDERDARGLLDEPVGARVFARERPNELSRLRGWRVAEELHKNAGRWSPRAGLSCHDFAQESPVAAMHRDGEPNVMEDVAPGSSLSENPAPSDAAYRLLFCASPLPLWVYDVETLRVLAVNEAACTKYGYSRDEFLDLKVDDLGKFDPGMGAHRLGDGTFINVEVASQEVLFMGRNCRMVCPVDVTQRVRVETTLREREGGLARAQSLARLAHVITRPDGSFESWSETLPELAAIEPGQMPRTTRDWMHLLHPDDQALFRTRSMEAQEKGHRVDVEYRIPRPTGLVHVRQVIEPIGPEHAASGKRWFSTLQDITEQKRAQATLERMNEELEQRVHERTAQLEASNRSLELATVAAEEANRAKSSFLATMSHEIRTPMNGVIGMVDVLSLSQLPPHLADAVSTIRTSALSLLGLIDDILDFSKIEAGHLELERVPVALPDLIESVCNTLMPVAAAKHVELDLFIAPQLPAQVWSDPTRLRQVLYNLAGNAIKFSAGASDRPGRVSISAEPGAGTLQRLVLRIADNGIGIASDTLGKLFTAFTQAEAATTRRFGGTGLGLAICNRLVTLLKGEIEVRSELGVGSTFTVTLPIDEVAGSAPTPVADVRDLDCIVIGSDVQAKALRDYLEHGGSRVHAAEDEGAAVQRAIGLKHPVVIQNLPIDGPLAALPGARHVWVARGARRRARAATDDLIVVDGNCLRRSALLQAVAVAAGRAVPDALDEARQAVAAAPSQAPTIAEARAQGRLLLIAEDDEINRKVILRQIALLGYAAEMASNGVEALDMWRAGRYGLLLTDLHMPEMDGYSLVEAIRREEASRGIARGKGLPILALTANALRSEATRAEAVGMNQYLTKPLNLGLLKAALARWLPEQSAAAASGGVSPAAPPDPPKAALLDLAALKSIVGEDPAVMRGLLNEYRLSTERMATDLRTARDRADTRELAAIAHRLKSASRSVGALVVGDRSSDLENACEMGIEGPISKAVGQLVVALEAAHAEIAQLLSGRSGDEHAYPRRIPTA